MMRDDTDSIEFLLACLRGDERFARSRLEQGMDLSGVVEAAVRLEVVHRLADGLAPLSALVPETLTEAMADHGRRIERHNANLMTEARRIAEAFAAADCALVFAKGPFFTASTGDCDRRRLSKDIDLYVRGQDIRRAYDLLRRLGFIEEHYPLEETLRDSHHHGVYSPASGVTAELHWAIAPAREDIRFDIEPIIVDPAIITIDGVAFPVPRRDHLPLFHAIELEKDSWRSLKKLLDMARLADALTQDEADSALARARTAGKARVLAISLNLIDQLGLARLRTPLAEAAAIDAASIHIARFVAEGIRRWGQDKSLGFLIRHEFMMSAKHANAIARIRYLATVSLRHARGHWRRRRARLPVDG